MTRSFAIMAAGVCAVALAVPAQAQTRDYAIAPGSLKAALNAYVRQSGRQLLFRGSEMAGVRSNGARGTLSADEALAQILAGTGFRARVDATSAVAIVRNSSAAQDPAAGNDAGADADSEGAEGGELVVTGSRLRAIGKEGPTPVTTFNRQKIDELGANSVAAVLDYLPQQSFSFSDSANFGGAKKVQLRGLGVGTTLVLINGRRTVTSALQGSRAFFDINTIPLAAVERVEVLSSSASAVYGADAIGGVVNVILKKDIDRPVLDAYYGFTPEGGSDERRLSASVGVSSDRFRGVLTMDYLKRTPLFGYERAITASQDFRPYGGIDRRSANANPGNVSSANGGLLPGLNASFAAVPVGSTGIGLTPASFAATAGTRNLASPSRYRSIVPDSERVSLVAGTEYDLSPNITMFGEFLFSSNRNIRTLSPPTVSNVLVPATNPFNPFGVPVRVNFLLTGVGTPLDLSHDDSYRAVAGLKGKLGGWDWEVSGLWTHNTGDNPQIGTVDATKVAAALASTNPATALNPFQDGPGGSPELLASLIAPSPRSAFGSTAKQVTAYASGSLFRLPGGSVEMVIGGELRSEAILFQASGINLAVDRKTEAAFGELRVPVVSPDMNVPLVRRLTLTAAGRYDHYNDIGGTFNPQLGAEWLVNRDLSFRASYSTSFKAPSLFELYQPMQLLTGLTVPDFQRNSESYPIDILVGGSTALDPEKAKAFSAGAVLTPSWLDGFRLDVDYWRIKQNLRVQRFAPLDILRNEAAFPDRVLRETPTAADIAAGLPGHIQRLVATSINYGGVDTDGVDIKAVYSVKSGIGTFQPSLSATFVNSFGAANFPGIPTVERAGLASVDGSIPKWRGTGSLSWSLDGLQLSATGRYIDSYADVDFTGARTGRRVASQLIFDLQAGIRFGDDGVRAARWLDGFAFRVGAINAFNRKPPYSEVDASGLDGSLADLRQRFVYFKVTKQF